MKKKRLPRNYLSVVLMASFFLLILTFGFFFSKPFKIPKEVEAVVGTLNLNVSGSTLTPGGIWKSDGTVGIGTTAPGKKLDVNGDITVSSSGIIYGNDVRGISGNFYLNYAGGGITAIGNNGALRIAAGESANVMNITAGNVGIGTTAPAGKLQVAATGGGTNIRIASYPAVGAAYSSEALVLGDNVMANEGATSGMVNINTHASYAGSAIWLQGSNGITFHTKSGAATAGAAYSSPVMKIDTAGNVGIGTTAPGAKLEVTGTGDINIGKFSGNSTTYGTIWTTNSAAGGPALYAYAGNVIVNTGSVGIGTTGPVAKLQSTGAAQTAAPTLGSPTGGALLLTNTDPLYGTLFGTSSTGKGWIQQQRVDASATAYDLTLQPSGGNVGIGTTSPGYLLDVNNGATAAYPLSLTSSSKFVHIGALNSSYAHIDTDATLGFYMYDPLYVGAANNFLNISSGNSYLAGSGGNVGIGTASPGAYKLNVNGNLYINGSITAGTSVITGPYYVCVDSNGTLGGYTSCSSSDARLKTNIDDISHQRDVLSDLQKLRGVYYNWDISNPANKRKDSGRQVGMIAQDVEKVLPELVSIGTDGYRTLNYPQYTGFLTEVAKAQQTQITSLQSITTDFINNFKAGLIETKKLIIDGVDVLKKLNELSAKVEIQQKQIDELKELIKSK